MANGRETGFESFDVMVMMLVVVAVVMVVLRVYRVYGRTRVVELSLRRMQCGRG